MSFLTFLYSPVLVLVVAMEKVERSSGSLIGSSIASIQKSAAPEVFFFSFFFESLRNYMSLSKTSYGVQLTILNLCGSRCYLHSWMKLILVQP